MRPSFPIKATWISLTIASIQIPPQYVYVVVDGAIQRREVTLGPIVDGLRVIRKGLEGDETLVIEGLLQARPESKVNAIAGTIRIVEDGLPDEYQPVPKEQWISPAPDPLHADGPDSASVTVSHPSLAEARP